MKTIEIIDKSANPKEKYFNQTILNNSTPTVPEKIAISVAAVASINPIQQQSDQN
jgi:hypothetical protein